MLEGCNSTLMALIWILVGNYLVDYNATHIN